MGSEMIVCLCKGVSCQTIRGEIKSGRRSLKEIGQSCRAGTGRGCGACARQIREMIEEEGCGTMPVSASKSAVRLPMAV